MDIALPGTYRNQAWAETMVNLEARKLIAEANKVSSFHLNDGLNRIKFIEEIKGVIEQQFAIARRAKSDEDCMSCIKNLRAETESLQEQDRQLRTRVAQVYAKVELVRENNKIVGYVISAVNVVLSGLTVVGGVALFGTMNPIGMLAGAALIVDGLNGISKEINNNFLEQPESQGAFADGAMAAAEFMGFERATGLGIYRGATLAADAYGVFGLLRKPGSWRLFHYLPNDFYRNVSNMSRPKLTMKIVTYGLKAKIVFDLLATDSATN